MVVPRFAAVAGGAISLVLACSASATTGFPGRAGKIAFVSDESGSNDILVMNPDGSGRENLTTGPEDDSDPAWSPGGHLVVFVRGGAIWSIRSDGSGLKRLAAGASPAWAPDGGRLVYSRRAGTGVDLYTMRSDGSGARRLTRTAVTESEPEWSPDGRLIAFARSGVASASHVYVIKSNGKGLRRITGGALEDLSPSWSPDGHQLAFVRNDEALGASRVFVTTLDGKRTRPLVGKLQLDPAATLESGPAWSPDGKRIVFVRGARLYSDLYVASADGKFLRRMTDNAVAQVADAQPTWQRLGSRKGPAGG